MSYKLEEEEERITTNKHYCSRAQAEKKCCQKIQDLSNFGVLCSRMKMIILPEGRCLLYQGRDVRFISVKRSLHVFVIISI